MSYIILRGYCWDIIVLNVHAPTEDKIDDVKDRFYEKLEHAFDKFPNYHTKIMLGDFNAKVRREDIFKPTIGNESLYEISNNNGVRVINFATSKTLTVKSTMFPHYKIHKPLGRPRRRWVNITMDLREKVWGGMDWIDLAQDKD
jgi:exonuclease III